MADYKEVQGSGKAWKRGHTFVAYNPYEGDKLGVFHEEQVATVGTQVIRTQDQSPVGLQVPFVEDGHFPLLNPLTGEPTGATMTHAELYAVLYSLYMDAALKRDAAEEAAAAAGITPVPSGPFAVEPGASDFA